MTTLLINYSSMKLDNVAASATKTFTLEHVPQFLGVNFLATGTIINVTVNTDIDGMIVNLNEAGIRAIGQSQSFALLTAAGDNFNIPLADGEIKGRRCTITVQTGAGASGCDVYDTSLVESFTQQVYSTNMMNILANGSADLAKFTRCVILSMGASDKLTYRANVGTTTMMLTKEELVTLGAMVYNNGNDDVVIDNRNQQVGTLTFSPTAERTVVYHRMQIGGSTSMGQMVDNAIKNVNNSKAPSGIKQVLNKNLIGKKAMINAK